MLTETSPAAIVSPDISDASPGTMTQALAKTNHRVYRAGVMISGMPSHQSGLS